MKEAAAAKADVVVAALDAPRRIPKATDAEKAAVCPWAKGFLGNAELAVGAAAGSDMVWCRGESIDALIAEAEKRLKDKQ